MNTFLVTVLYIILFVITVRLASGLYFWIKPRQKQIPVVRKNGRPVLDFRQQPGRFGTTKSDQKLMKYREIQKEIIEQGYTAKCPLIICVDARKDKIAGYCVNVVTGTCHMYVFAVNILPYPWKSQDGHSHEVKLQNLLFALLLWEDQIKASRQVRIHTRNSAIEQSREDGFVLKVWKYFEHLNCCERVKTTKKGQIFINPDENPRAFAQFVFPAEDLSRWRLESFRNFIKKAYGSNIFVSTHSIKLGNRTSHQKTPHSVDFFEKADGRLRKWILNPCSKCGFKG